MVETVALPPRARVEARLERLVLENRFTIAVVFPVVGAVVLLASAFELLPPPLAFNPYLVLAGVVVMRLPLVAGLAPLVGRRAALGLAGLVAYAYGIEFLGVTTGFPYGEFVYLIDLGPMLGGAVPIGLPVFFLPLVVNSYLLCLLVLGRWVERPAARLLAVVGAVLALDLVLDPGAVALGFWAYADGGAYYGVPWSNYAGWVLSATVTVAVLDRSFAHGDLQARLDACPFMLDDLVSFVLLWGLVNAVYGNWVPVTVAGLFAVALVRTERFDLPI